MKTVFIPITRGTIIRNYFHTDIISGLTKHNIRVVALVPFFDNKEVLKDLETENLIFEPLTYPKKITGESFFLELFKGAIFNNTIRTYYKYKFLTYEPKYAYYYPRALFYWCIKHIPGIKKIAQSLDTYLNPQYDDDYLFEKYKPDLVFSTTPHERSDIGIIKGARRFNVPVIGMPKTWDNLSKTLFPIKLDQLFVWSQYMKDEAIRFQDYAQEQVSIVGIPHFDFYARKELQLSREDFCKKHGLDPRKKIILYGSTGAGFDESGYLELIHSFKEQGLLGDIQVLMRPHIGYANEIHKFNPLEKYSGFVVDRSDKQSSAFKDRWDISFDHIQNLYNSVYHADVCVNIASTLTFDATACGTPVVNICFDTQEVEYKKSLARVYETDYFSSVIRFNGTWVARNKEEFAKCLTEALQSKQGKSEQRNKLIEYFMYTIDGQSSKRLVEAILSMLK